MQSPGCRYLAISSRCYSSSNTLRGVTRAERARSFLQLYSPLSPARRQPGFGLQSGRAGCNTSFQVFGRLQSNFGAENHVQARCKFLSRTVALLHVGQNRGPLPRHENLPVGQSHNISHSKRLIFGKSGSDWDIFASAMKIFLREIHAEYRHTQTLKQPMEMAPGLLVEETNITVNHF